jgi:hypothetical protein
VEVVTCPFQAMDRKAIQFARTAVDTFTYMQDDQVHASTDPYHKFFLRLLACICTQVSDSCSYDTNDWQKPHCPSSREGQKDLLLS